MTDPRAFMKDVDIPPRELYNLGLILSEAVQRAAAQDPRFAAGWLACCEAIMQIGDGGNGNPKPPDVPR